MRLFKNLLNCESNLLTFLLPFFITLNFIHAQLPAFPEAYGAAAFSEGARGGVVLHVTSLADGSREDVGTLRWAIQGTENKALDRTIVFDVSGVIELQDWIRCSNLPGDEGGYTGSIYIAGQSAPEGGITITGERIIMSGVPNLIIRYIKFRNSGGYSGSIHVGRGDNAIIDHCSISHVSNSTAASMATRQEGDLTNSTFSNNLFGQCSYALIIGETTPEPARQLEDGSFTVMRNAYYNAGHRVPFKGGSAIKADVVNNIVHNWQYRLIRMDHWDYKLNHIENYYQASINTTNRLLWCGYNENPSATPQIYNQNNFLQDEPRGNYSVPNGFDSDESVAWTRFQVNFEPLPSEWFVNASLPIQGRPYEIWPNSVLKDNVLPEVGACKYIDNNGNVVFSRDIYDTEYVDGIINDVNEPRNTTLALPIQTLSNTRPANFYQSNPHIPEVWFNVNVPNGQDHNDIAPSGYTWLEEYLNQVDNTAPIPVINVTGVDVTPETAEILIPDSITLTATITPNDATDQSGVWTSSDETIATVDASGIVTPVTVGEVIITFTTNDGGYSDTSVITVFPEAFEANAGLDQTICQGESVVLSASGGITYLWSNGETTASIEVSPTVTTTYTVTAFDDLGNSDDDSVTVTVNELPIAEAGNDQTICEGDTVTLTASGGNQYLWSTGETTASISVAPTSDTAYTVEVTTNGCSSTDDVNVFVNPLPNITVSNDVTIMDGETTMLTVSGSDNYLWSTGETTESIDVTPSVTTTYTVTSTSVNGCTSNSEVTVTVVPELIANAGEDVEICSGEETVLTASGGVSYTWNTGATSAQLTVSPNTTTTYTVTVEDGFGNSDSDSVTVTVNDSPTLTITEDLTIVEGESIQLTISGASTYAWSTGETSNTIDVSPNETTTYTVIGTTATCSTEAQVTVTVEELLVVSAGQDENVCENDSYEVVLTASLGDSYLWSTGETTQSITVSPLSTTTYSVTVTSGIQEDTDDVTVFVNPNPDVVILNGESVDIMSGDFVTLSASGANTYEWNNGATQPNIAVSPSQTTTYEVRGYIGDCYDEKQVTVNVIPEVEADAGEDQEICLGDIVTLTATGGDGSEYEYEYEWSTGENTQSIQVSPTETTEYTVTVFNALDFDEDTVTVFVDSNCTDDGGVVEDPIDGTALDFEFAIFPNPANEYVDIKLSGSDQLTNFYLYDMTGKLIFQKRVENESLSVSSTTRIDVSSLRPGLYMVKLVDLRRELNKRLMIRK
jgi:uncharacterized protein YjdB